eukprot:superscaffoldBa00002400_g14128
MQHSAVTGIVIVLVCILGYGTGTTAQQSHQLLNYLACGKAPGNNGIPPEVIKAGKNSALLNHLHELLLQCWEEGTVPQDMHDANIITLYKNKGDCGDCNNYHRISLLSIVGKAFACVVMNRLQSLAERVYPEMMAYTSTPEAREFGLTISLKKTNIMGQDVKSTCTISISNYTPEVVEVLTYLGSTISNNFTLDTELNTRIGKAATTTAC